MRAINMRAFLIAAVAALAWAASFVTGQAQTFVQGNTYIQPFNFNTCFPVNSPVTNFSGTCSVASWIYWFNTPGGNTPMTNDVSLDYANNTNSGCLIYSVPFANASNTQDVIFGTFGNQYGYDTSILADLTHYTNFGFWIRADPSTAPRQVNGTNVDYGTISAGFFYPYSFESEGSVTIPLSASNAWVHLNVPINPASAKLTGINGLAFNVSTFGTTGNGVPNYPALQNSIFYLDELELDYGAFNPPVTLAQPYKPVPGYNAIATTPGIGGEFNRYQIITAADTGYTFVSQPSTTYSWNIQSFPAGTGGNFQQHFFIVDGAPGPFDQAIDYNLGNVFWVTVQQSDAGVANMNFRLKTNEPGGNGMLFNTISPTDTVNNPHGWPIEPIATLADSNGAAGTWTVNIQNNTNITVTSPTGLSTNFSITTAQAAAFADPVSLVLGGQPNNPNGAGKAVVYGGFSASGVATPISDNFLADTSFNLNLWHIFFSSDTNGVVLVPGNAAWWVPWSLPDGGFALQTKANLTATGGWTQPSPLIIRDNNKDQALILSNQLTDPMQGYFQLVQYHASMLQVLFAGQTNAPGTTLGYTGSPTPISGATGAGALAIVTVNAVDAGFHIDNGNIDLMQFNTSADPNATLPLNTALVNGTVNVNVLFTTPGSWTVTATDLSTATITAGTSVPITVNP